MTTMTDAGFVEMRLRTAVGVRAGQDEPCSVVVLDGVSQDRRLAITIGSAEALTLSASLAALVQAPIFVAPDVLADAEGRLDGDSAEAASLRLALAVP